MSGAWDTVLTQAARDGVVFTLNSGKRTMAEQQALFNQNMIRAGVPKLGHAFTAVPSRTAPHIRVGFPNHALDIDSLDGGEARLEEWVEEHGVDWKNTVSGESWHGEVSLAGLTKLYNYARRMNAKEKAKAKAKAAAKAKKLALIKKKAEEKSERERKARLAKTNGIGYALVAIEEAVPLKHVSAALALAMVWQESSGRNVWGGDPAPNGGTSGWHNSHVTASNYRSYKIRRGSRGQGGMQGVGPLQLTFYTIQDEADRLGGAWKPRINIRTGLRHLDGLIGQFGYADGIRRYNGAGPAAEAYSRSVRARAEAMRKLFDQ